MVIHSERDEDWAISSFKFKIMNNNQLQVILTGKFGDGHIVPPKTSTSNSYYCTNSINEPYIIYKKALLGELATDVTSAINRGYKDNIIYTVSTKRTPEITDIYNASIEDSLDMMDELGLAMWFYDDGSLHKKKNFYNLNTHAYSREIQEDVLIPFLNRFNIYPKVTGELKKDGRQFYYLRISRHEGSYEISKILQKYYVDCYNYKIWSSETIQKWSKLQEQLKSENRSISHRGFSNLLELVEL